MVVIRPPSLDGEGYEESSRGASRAGRSPNPARSVVPKHPRAGEPVGFTVTSDSSSVLPAAATTEVVHRWQHRQALKPGIMRSLLGVCLAGVLLLSACGDPEEPATAVPTTTLPPTTTTTTLPPTTTTTSAPSTTTTTTTTTTLPPTTTTTTTIPFPERLRPDLAAFNILVACLEENVAEMDAAALVSAIASELAVYNRTQSKIDIRFFELEAGFLRCLPELPAYASARVELGEAVEGVLDYADDVDVFVFQATENQLYEISVDLGTLVDSIVTVYDKDETQLARNDDQEASLDSRLVWRAPSSSDYYVAVEGYDAGTYQVTVELSDVVDDHSDRIDSEVSRVGVGEAAGGVLDYPDDADFFVFAAIEGMLYQIDVTDTLISPVVQVYDTDENFLAWGDWGEPLVSLKAPTSGDYYVGVSGTGTGSYTLTVGTAVDDYPDQFEDAARVELEEPLEGVLEYADDIDMFMFQATEKQLYEIRVDLGTLSDSIVAVHDADEVQLGWNDDEDGSLASHLIWEAPTTDAYYIAVSGYGAGSYTLTVQPTD